MAKKIIVKVVNGKPTITTDGYSGDECVRATTNLENRLSGEGGVEVREYTGGVAESERQLAD